ncbi:MAG: T9SS type A sorting domain-containing protein, partial [Balneola sp.]
LFGKEDFLSEFSGPDLDLWPDTTDLSNEQVFFGGLNNVASGDFDGDGVQDIVTKSFRHADSEFDEGVGALTYFFGKEGLSSQPDTTVRIRNEYIAPERSSSENIYSKFSGRSLLKAVPGKNGEGADRLLFVPGSSLANAVLYEIEKEPTEVAVARFSAPAENTSLNPAGNFINKQYFPLVGDYTGNGQLNFLGYQPNSRIYRDTPIYMFGIDNILNSNEEGVEGNPNIYKLEQNYPNPFNPSTNISFTIPVSENVEITVYNILGKKVSEITNKKFTKGTHTVSFDASHLASGFYLYQINTNSFISTKKMILIK